MNNICLEAINTSTNPHVLVINYFVHATQRSYVSYIFFYLFNSEQATSLIFLNLERGVQKIMERLCSISHFRGCSKYVDFTFLLHHQWIKESRGRVLYLQKYRKWVLYFSRLHSCVLMYILLAYPFSSCFVFDI